MTSRDLQERLTELETKIKSTLDRGDQQEAETLKKLHSQLYAAWRKSLLA